MQVLDKFCLDAAFIAVGGLDTLRRAFLLRLLVAKLYHANLDVVIRVDFVLTLLDGLQIAGRAWSQFDRGLHLELLPLAEHKPSLILPLLLDAVGNYQILGWSDCIYFYKEGFCVGVGAWGKLEVAEL